MSIAQTFEELALLISKLAIPAEHAATLEQKIAPMVRDIAVWDTLSAARRAEIQLLMKDEYVLATLETLLNSHGTGMETVVVDAAEIMSDSAKGFLLPEFQDAFVAWKTRTGETDPALWLKYLDETATAPLRARSMLSILRANGLSATISKIARRTPKLRALYPGMDWLVLREGGSEAAAMAREASNLSGKVSAVMTRYSYKLSGDATKNAARIEALLKRMLPSGNTGQLTEMTEDGMRRLMGSKALHSDELVASLVRCINWLDDIAARAGKTGVDAEKFVDEMLEIEGIEWYFKTIITRDGYEHGARFEAETLAKLIVQDGAKPRELLLQVDLADQWGKGPDIAWLRNGVITIIQGKSYKSLSALTRASANAEIFRQLVSDLARYQAKAFMLYGARIGRSIRFEIDFRRLVQGYRGEETALIEVNQAVRDEADTALTGMMTQVNIWLKDPKTMADFGLSASDTPFQVVIKLVVWDA